VMSRSDSGADAGSSNSNVARASLPAVPSLPPPSLPSEDSPQRSEAFRLVPAVCGVLCLACIGFCVGLLADQQFQQAQIDRLQADVRRLVEDSSSNAGTTARRAQRRHHANYKH
ncbi:unnamed protein product, partial [Polarella glacialis]